MEDFVVREITNREEGKEGKYLILEITKRDWDTHHLTRTLAKVLQISQKRIGVAGTKDKRALTTQKISIFDIDASEIENVHLKDIELKVLGRSRKSIELGDLWGNDFIITIRDIASSPEETKKLLDKTTNEILAQSGVPNFFGIQRFGSIRPVTHLVGKAIVEGDLEKAALLYIAEPFPDEPDDTKKARQFVKETRDFKEGLKTYPLRLGSRKSHDEPPDCKPERLCRCFSCSSEKPLQDVCSRLPIIHLQYNPLPQDRKRSSLKPGCRRRYCLFQKQCRTARLFKDRKSYSRHSSCSEPPD